MRLVVFSICVLAVTSLPMSSGCAAQPTGGCRKIAINSAGTFGFDAKRISTIATGSGGLNGVANYITISPPPGIDDALKIIVIANVAPARSPQCRADSEADRTVSCAMSLTGYALKVVIRFNAGSAGMEFGAYEAETRKIASYVSTDVLCST